MMIWAVCKNELLPNGPKQVAAKQPKMGRFWNFFGQAYLKITLGRGHIIVGLLATEWQTPKGNSVYGWVKCFVPDFNKLTYSLRS